MPGSDGLERRDLPVWLRGRQVQRRVSDADRSAGVLGRFGMGYKLATQTGIGLGKTIEAGRIVAEMVHAERRSPVFYVTNGQSRAMGLLEVGRVLSAAGDATVPGEGVLRAEPFASRRIRARTVSRRARYRELRRRAEARENNGRDEDRLSVSGERRVRDRAAREAVQLRSGDRCENPACLLPDLPYRTTAGRPLLEIDHIDDHAVGGRDHPSSMIALCPNCHANKTRGADGVTLRERLRPVARALDAALAQEA